MPLLKVSGLGPSLDGEYDADISSFTNRELHLIKKESGVRAGEIVEAMQAGDNDLFIALALIILQREGKGSADEFRDVVWDADAGAITFDLTEEEKAQPDDDLPPPSEPVSSSDANGSATSSGEPSTNDSAPPANDLNPTGSRLLDIGATSGHAI